MKLDENKCCHTEKGIQAGEADAETKESLLNNVTLLKKICVNTWQPRVHSSCKFGY
jgi:hypothetical protein